VGKPKQPPAPDYAAAATAQGVANKDTAVSNSSLGNPNVVSPYGNQTVTYDTTGPGGNYQPTVTQTLTPEAQATLNSQQQVQRGLADLGNQAVGTVQGVMGTPFQYNGPSIQTSVDGSQPLNYGPSAGQYGLAQGGVSGPNLQTSFGGYGDVQSAPSAGQYGQAGGVNAGAYGQARGYGAFDAGAAGGVNPNQYGQARGVNAGQFGNLQNQANMSNVAAMPVNAGMTAQQAILQRLQPQIGQNNAALDQQLANQGVTSGSEAYNNAMRTRDQANNDLYSQAALQGIGIDMNANQQGYGQAMGQASLYNAAQGQGFSQAAQAQQMRNQAIGQNFGQGLQAQQLGNQATAQNFGQVGAANAAQNAAVGQNFGQGVTSQQLGNQAVAQNFGQAMQSNAAQNAAQAQQYAQMANNAQFNNASQLSQFNSNLANQQAANAAIQQNYGQGATSAGLYNNAAGQAYNQNLGAAQFGNQAALQSYQQQLAQYNQPLNQISALMSGSQIQNPQFQSYTGSQAAPAPVFQGVQAQGQYAQDVYGQQMAGYNGMMGAIGGLGGGVATGGLSKGGFLRGLF